MKRSLRIAGLFFLQFAALAQPVQMRPLQGHLPAAVAHLTPLGRLPAGNVLHLAIGLPLRNQEVLTHFLQRLYDPASPDYHRYLTSAQFTEKFGPTAQDYQTVIDFAKSNGLAVVTTHESRLLLDVRERFRTSKRPSKSPCGHTGTPGKPGKSMRRMLNRRWMRACRYWTWSG